MVESDINAAVVLAKRFGVNEVLTVNLVLALPRECRTIKAKLIAVCINESGGNITCFVDIVNNIQLSAVILICL